MPIAFEDAQVESWSCPWEELMRSIRLKEWRNLLSLTLDRTLTHQQHKLLLSLSEVINFKMLWNREEVLRVMKLHYIRIMDSFSANIKMPIRKVPQNGTSKWFCLLPHHDSWKVNLLVLEVCKLCGAHYNGLLVIFNRHFRRLWRTSWNIPKSITNCARSLSEKSVF